MKITNERVLHRIWSLGIQSPSKKYLSSQSIIYDQNLNSPKKNHEQDLLKNGQKQYRERLKHLKNDQAILSQNNDTIQFVNRLNENQKQFHKLACIQQISQKFTKDILPDKDNSIERVITIVEDLSQIPSPGQQKDGVHSQHQIMKKQKIHYQKELIIVKDSLYRLNRKYEIDLFTSKSQLRYCQDIIKELQAVKTLQKNNQISEVQACECKPITSKTTHFSQKLINQALATVNSSQQTQAIGNKTFSCQDTEIICQRLQRQIQIARIYLCNRQTLKSQFIEENKDSRQNKKCNMANLQNKNNYSDQFVIKFEIYYYRLIINVLQRRKYEAEKHYFKQHQHEDQQSNYSKEIRKDQFLDYNYCYHIKKLSQTLNEKEPNLICFEQTYQINLTLSDILNRKQGQLTQLKQKNMEQIEKSNNLKFQKYKYKKEIKQLQKLNCVNESKIRQINLEHNYTQQNMSLKLAKCQQQLFFVRQQLKKQKDYIQTLRYEVKKYTDRAYQTIMKGKELQISYMTALRQKKNDLQIAYCVQKTNNTQLTLQLEKKNQLIFKCDSLLDQFKTIIIQYNIQIQALQNSINDLILTIQISQKGPQHIICSLSQRQQIVMQPNDFLQQPNTNSIGENVKNIQLDQFKLIKPIQKLEKSKQVSNISINTNKIQTQQKEFEQNYCQVKMKDRQALRLVITQQIYCEDELKNQNINKKQTMRQRIMSKKFKKEDLISKSNISKSKKSNQALQNSLPTFLRQSRLSFSQCIPKDRSLQNSLRDMKIFFSSRFKNQIIKKVQQCQRQYNHFSNTIQMIRNQKQSIKNNMYTTLAIDKYETRFIDNIFKINDNRSNSFQQNIQGRQFKAENHQNPIHKQDSTFSSQNYCKRFYEPVQRFSVENKDKLISNFENQIERKLSIIDQLVNNLKQQRLLLIEKYKKLANYSQNNSTQQRLSLQIDIFQQNYAQTSSLRSSINMHLANINSVFSYFIEKIELGKLNYLYNSKIV